MIDPMALSASQLLHGSVDPLPDRLPLRAGPLALVLEAGDLRSIQVDGVDIINRIYGAVRNGEWATIPGRLSGLQVDRGDDWFRLTYTSEHVGGDVDFVWRARIDGTPDGAITVAFSGEARVSFARNRIGLCVLHPLTTCAGRDATARLVDGSSRAVQFPHDVSVEQPIVGFRDLAGLHWSAAPGVDVDLRLEGDTFETEDQRNWIDPSFKTYSTPLSLPRPVVVPAGTRIEQRVTLRVHRTPNPLRSSPSPSDWGQTPIQHPGQTPQTGVRPQIGLCAAGQMTSSSQLALLRSMQLAHLRVDLVLEGAWQPELRLAVDRATALECALELALDVGSDPSAALRALAHALPHGLPVARVIVFGSGQLVTTQAALDAVRADLSARRPDLGPLVSGSRLDLYQVHLFDPPRAAATSWGMQPQAHATDTTSIAETPVAAGHQVRAVRRRRPGPIAISVVRLHKSLADPRQMSLLGAAWTLAVLAELIAAGADSITLCDMCGPRGVMADGVVFPLFHVIADVAELADGTGTELVGPADGVTGLLTRRALLLANLSREPRTVDLPGRFRPHRVRRLDAATVVEAMRAPHEFRRRAVDWPHRHVTLPPFATARIDGGVAQPFQAGADGPR